MKKAKKATRKSKTSKATRKKSPTKKTVRAKSSSALADSLYMGAGSDPAHAAGHKKMNLRAQVKKAGQKNKPQNESALNHMAKSDRIKRTSVNRRFITGAAVGKTGQIVIK